jgi:hypothetical protein
MTLKETKTSSSCTLGDSPRSGKWTKEESDYVDLLIAEFRCGALPIRGGTTLRSFLSKMINCNPKRVSKKYENTGYSGKSQFQPSVIPISMAEMSRRRERLQEYERSFLLALKRANDDPESEEQGKPTSFDEESRAMGVKSTLAGHPSHPGLKASPWMRPVEEEKAVAAFLKVPPAIIGSRKPSLVANPSYHDRITDELLSRMDAANCLSRANSTIASAANVRDLPLSTSVMSFKPPSPFASSQPVNTPQVGGSHIGALGGPGSTLHQLATFDFASALKKHKPAPLKRQNTFLPNVICGLPGQHYLDSMRHSELAEDPLMRQVRMQQQAAVEQRAQRLLLDRSKAKGAQRSFPAPQYLCQASQPESDYVFKRAARGDVAFHNMAELTFPSLPEADRPAALGHLSSVQIASLVSRGDLGAFAQGLSHRDVMTGARQRPSRTPGSNFDLEIAMIASLKREHDGSRLDNCRPFKRIG